MMINLAKAFQYEPFAKRHLRAHKSFSTPRRLASALQAKRSLTLAFLTPLEPCCDGGVPRKINKFALQAAFFKGLSTPMIKGFPGVHETVLGKFCKALIMSWKKRGFLNPTEN